MKILGLGFDSKKNKCVFSKLPSRNTAKGFGESWKVLINLGIDQTSLYGSQPAIVFPYIIAPLTLSCFGFWIILFNETLVI
jgi:hypothetical protein